MFMSACRVHARYDELRDYMMALTVPRSYSSLASLFEAARLRQALRVGKFQCDCSEFMTLAPAIGRYLREVVVHRTDDVRVRSMLAVLDVLEMLPAARTLGAVDHVALGTAIKAHLDANGSGETPAAPSPPHPTPHPTMVHIARVALAAHNPMRPRVTLAATTPHSPTVCFHPPARGAVAADSSRRRTVPTICGRSTTTRCTSHCSCACTASSWPR